MGAHRWHYFVPFQQDVAATLEALRQREFAAGRYGKDESLPPAGSIEEAIDRTHAEGTRSVLDMIGGISAEPRDHCVSPLHRERMLELFGTDKPTREMVERSYGPPRFAGGVLLPNIFDDIKRGRGVYVVVYENDAPSEIFFAGYSFD